MSPFGSGLFGFLGGVPLLFGLVFLAVIGVFVYVIGKAVVTAVYNSGQPLIDREARVIGKRQSSHVSGGMNNMPATSSNSYYVTFEFRDGNREELHVNGRQYGMLAEGDEGMLHSQGTWFKGFERVGGGW